MAVEKVVEKKNTELFYEIYFGVTAIELCDIDGSTPLALAVANGHRELARILIENGAGLDTADKLGMTPIFRSVKIKVLLYQLFLV